MFEIKKKEKVQSSTMISIRIPNLLKTKLDTLSNIHDVDRSKIIVQAIEYALENIKEG